jgi:D-alanyl-D-alanine dipeptidase
MNNGRSAKGDILRLGLSFCMIAASAVVLGAGIACVPHRRSTPHEKTAVSFTEISSAPEESKPSAASPDIAPPPEKADFVRVKDYIPDIEVELVYATENNFTGQKIYEFDDAWLRYGTVKKLRKVQNKLKKQGARLKIWDAFRPVSAQFRLWEICPDARYVSNPNKGFSSHSRGNTVDVTLIDGDGSELVMPTGFDDFTGLADRDYSDVKNRNAVRNAKLLEKAMKECGFKPYFGEWWHFSDSDSYDAAKDFIPG